jgi:hypothetical protein
MLSPAHNITRPRKRGGGRPAACMQVLQARMQAVTPCVRQGARVGPSTGSAMHTQAVLGSAGYAQCRVPSGCRVGVGTQTCCETDFYACICIPV